MRTWSAVASASISRPSGAVRPIGALVARDYRITASYRLAFVLDLFYGVVNLVIFYFISETFENFKNTGSVYMPDIEPKEVGSFDDTQLKAIDQLMVEAHERGECSILPHIRPVADSASPFQTSSSQSPFTIDTNSAAGATTPTFPSTTYQPSIARTGKPATTM